MCKWFSTFFSKKSDLKHANEKEKISQGQKKGEDKKMSVLGRKEVKDPRS